MSENLYRTIVGQSVTPTKADDDVPKPYRRTAPLPPAPHTSGSASSEPFGDFDPTEEYPTLPNLPY